jgi:Fe-Mn family superoxide dismutase
MKLILRPLPYAYHALEPHIGAATLETHYDKHHRGYLDKMNEEIAGGPLEGKPLRDVVLASEGSLFNSAAQVWNHDFYWRSMSPDGGGKPSATLAGALQHEFGSVDAFRRELAAAATTHFGSGWVWLVRSRTGELRVLATHDADNPLTHGDTALLALDVWEHAYYLDYRNQRAKYVDAYLQHLINWDFAEQNLEGAQ